MLKLWNFPYYMAHWRDGIS